WNVMPGFQAANLRLEQRPHGIALLRLDVAGRSMNVFNRQVLADLDQALDAVAADPSIRVLAIRSDKQAGFVAGADLREFSDVKGPEDARSLSAAGQELFNKLANLAVPTIAM